MALEMNLLLKERTIGEQELESEIVKYFNSENLEAMRPSETCISYEGLYEKHGVIISLLSANENPKAYYDSLFVKGDFAYEQTISFDINKFGDLPEIYHTILEFILQLLKKYPQEALLTSESCAEVCLFQKDGKVFINKNHRYFEQADIRNYEIIETEL